MNNLKIGIEELAKRKDVSPSDYVALSTLATVFYGMTHTDTEERAARQFCIASAIRVLGEMRALIRERGL